MAKIITLCIGVIVYLIFIFMFIEASISISKNLEISDIVDLDQVTLVLTSSIGMVLCMVFMYTVDNYVIFGDCYDKED